MFGHPVPENIQNSHSSSSWSDRLFPSVPVSTASHLHACIPYTAPSSSTYRWFRGKCVVPWVAWSRCGNSKCSCSSGGTAPTTRQSMSLISSIIILLPIPHLVLDKSHKRYNLIYNMLFLVFQHYSFLCVWTILKKGVFNVHHSSLCIFWNITLFMYNISWYTILFTYTV